VSKDGRAHCIRESSREWRREDRDECATRREPLEPDDACSRWPAPRRVHRAARWQRPRLRRGSGGGLRQATRQTPRIAVRNPPEVRSCPAPIESSRRTRPSPRRRWTSQSSGVVEQRRCGSQAAGFSSTGRRNNGTTARRSGTFLEHRPELLHRPHDAVGLRTSGEAYLGNSRFGRLEGGRGRRRCTGRDGSRLIGQRPVSSRVRAQSGRSPWGRERMRWARPGATARLAGTGDPGRVQRGHSPTPQR